MKKFSKILFILFLLCFHIRLIIAQNNCQKQVNDLQLQKNYLTSEKGITVKQLKEGKYCSQCNRSQIEIEKSGVNFKQHLQEVNGQEIPAPPEIIKQKEAEYNQKIQEIDAQILYVRLNCIDVETIDLNTNEPQNDINNEIDNNYNPINLVDNTYNPENIIDNRYNEIQSEDTNAEKYNESNNTMPIDLSEQIKNSSYNNSSTLTGGATFFCCNKEFSLNYTIQFVENNVGMDETFVVFNFSEPELIEEIKIEYHLSLNLGERGPSKEIILKKEDNNVKIYLGPSRFRFFDINNISATCNPHKKTDCSPGTEWNPDGGLEINYTICYLYREGIGINGTDYYKVEGYLTNHYNTAIDYTFIAGTISFGLNMININANKLLPEKSMHFEIEKGSVIANCDIPNVLVKMPVVVLEKKQNDVLPIDSKKLPVGALNTTQAKAHIGQKGVVCGTVVSTKLSDNSDATFIYLDKQFPNQVFSITIWKDNLVNFSYKPEIDLKDKKVCVSGQIEDCKSVPCMSISNEKQVQFLDDD